MQQQMVVFVILPLMLMVSCNNVLLSRAVLLELDAGKKRKMKYSLITYPNDNLTVKTQNVTEFNQELHTLLDEMKLIMFDSNGMGLAATQVGSDKNVFISLNVNNFAKNKKEILEFINPVIIEQEKETQLIDEGCLSFPGLYLKLPRSLQVTVKAQNRHGEEFTVVAYGLEAVVMQHEIEHLNQKTFIDSLNRKQKRAALSRMNQ